MNSINLLPPNIKASIEQKKKNAAVLGLFYRSLLYAFLVAILTVGAYLYFEKDTQKIEGMLEVAEKNTNTFGQLEEKSASVAEKITAVKTIESKLNTWSNVVAEIQKVMPGGVYLSKATLTADSKLRAGMSGFSKNKEGVAALRDAMENSQYFEFVDIENASTEQDPRTGTELESFTLSFSLEKGALDD